jgi:hypothetical protein
MFGSLGRLQENKSPYDGSALGINQARGSTTSVEMAPYTHQWKNAAMVESRRFQGARSLYPA